MKKIILVLIMFMSQFSVIADDAVGAVCNLEMKVLSKPSSKYANDSLTKIYSNPRYYRLGSYSVGYDSPVTVIDQEDKNNSFLLSFNAVNDNYTISSIRISQNGKQISSHEFDSHMKYDYENEARVSFKTVIYNTDNINDPSNDTTVAKKTIKAECILFAY